MYFRIGGSSNNKATQILSSALDREAPKNVEYPGTGKLMYVPCMDLMTKEMHAQNSINVHKAVARMVPDVIKRWARREVKLNGRKYTLP